VTDPFSCRLSWVEPRLATERGQRTDFDCFETYFKIQ